MPGAVRSRRLVPLLVLLLQVCLGWTSLAALLHDDSDDPFCNPVLVLHDHNAHHVGAAKGPAPEPEHCFICHNQSLRSLAAAADSWMPAGGAEPVVFHVAPRTGLILVASRSARAPPLA